MKKNLKVVTCIVFVALFSFSTGSCGIMGGVSGVAAQQEIMAAVTETTILIAAMLAPSLDAVYGDGATMSAVPVSIMIDGVVVPAIVGIDTSKTYSRSSVDECVGNIRAVGFLFGTWIGAAVCNLETV